MTMPLIDELLPARPPWRVRRKYAHVVTLGLARQDDGFDEAALRPALDPDEPTVADREGDRDRLCRRDRPDGAPSCF